MPVGNKTDQSKQYPNHRCQCMANGTLRRHGSLTVRSPLCGASLAHREWTRWAVALAPTVNAGILLRSKRIRSARLALRHDRRRSFALAFSDASATGNAYRDESCNQCHQKLSHLAPLFDGPLQPILIKTRRSLNALVLKRHSGHESASARNGASLRQHSQSLSCRWRRR